MQPSSHLLETIINRIQREEQIRIARRNLILFGVGSLLSLGGFFFTASTARDAILHSEISEFLSLLITNPQIIVTAGHDYALSLLEALPILQLIAFLSATFLVVGLGALLMRQIVTLVRKPLLSN